MLQLSLRSYVNTLLVSLLSFNVLMQACTTVEPRSDDQPLNPIDVIVQPLALGILLPGAYFNIAAQGLLTGSEITVSFRSNERVVMLESTLLTNGVLEARIPIDVHQTLGHGQIQGQLKVDVTLDQAQGSGESEMVFELVDALFPQLTQIGTWTAPDTERTLNGESLLRKGEGETFLSLDGTMISPEGSSKAIRTEILLDKIDEARRSAAWTSLASIWGITVGQFTGSASVINRTHVGEFQSIPMNVTLDYLKPQITGFSQIQISRGENISLFGHGFVGQESGYFTTVIFNGQLTLNDGGQVQNFENYTLNTNWISGGELQSYLNPIFMQDYNRCVSQDLGGQVGNLYGELEVSIHNQNGSMIGEKTNINLDIQGSKQVVFLKFLPAFTDSLRLFGLRNYSAQVIDKILDITRRDYAGINVDFRLTQPQDFTLYAVIEIGGPDPNSQSLFGLDNTAGLDQCNQRLDDYLAGKNADSGGTFGGVFVESFLRLSPSLGDSSLADPLFDDIFLPIIQNPAQINENETRMQQITQAIHVLGNLVGNTVSHELGHSLGLPVESGCGEYHNFAGELQIMDCGKDRPFLERAGLDPRGAATWTIKNRQYLERILPLP